MALERVCGFESRLRHHPSPIILLLFRAVVKVARERVESSCVWLIVTRVTDFVFVRHKIEPQTPGSSAYQADADVGYALRTLITYALKPSLP